MADVGALLADLAAESDVLDALVSDLGEEQWRTETPAPGWTIADQIAHLGWTDELAILAATDPGAFAAAIAELFDGPMSIDEVAASACGPPVRQTCWRGGATAAPASPPRSATLRPGRSCRGSVRR